MLDHANPKQHCKGWNKTEILFPTSSHFIFQQTILILISRTTKFNPLQRSIAIFHARIVLCFNIQRVSISIFVLVSYFFSGVHIIQCNFYLDCFCFCLCFFFVLGCLLVSPTHFLPMLEAPLYISLVYLTTRRFIKRLCFIFTLYVSECVCVCVRLVLSKCALQRVKSKTTIIVALQYAKRGDNSHHTNDEVSCGALNFYRNNEEKRRYQYTNEVVQWISTNISKRNPCVLFLPNIKIFHLTFSLCLFSPCPHSISLDLFRSIYPAVVETSQSTDFFRVHLPFLLFHMLTFNIYIFPPFTFYFFPR